MHKFLVNEHLKQSKAKDDKEQDHPSRSCNRVIILFIEITEDVIHHRNR